MLALGNGAVNAVYEAQPDHQTAAPRLQRPTPRADRCVPPYVCLPQCPPLSIM
jgi:hypothetical protein